MDFSKYKKVKEDKNSTTMASDAGHTITLMHKTMPRIQVEQLKRLKLGDGGRVGLHIPTEKKVKLDEAGNVGDAAAAQDVPVQAPEGQPNPAVGMANPDVAAPPPAQQPYAPNVNPQTGQTNSGAVNANAQTAAQNQGAVNAAASQAEIPQNVAYIKAQQQVAQQQQDAYNDIAKHTSDFAQHMQGVDPQHFVKSMPGGEKVATSLGLLVGGFVSGFHGGANPASDWLNTQINRDIDAQKNAQDVNKTVYGAYRQLYGDSTAAIAATKASMADIYTQMAKQIALKYGTPGAMNAAQGVANAAAMANPKLLKEGAVDLTALPGSKGIGGHAGAPQPVEHPGASQTRQSPKDDNPNSILAPNAVNILKSAPYGDPRMAADFAPGGAGAQQYSQAVQVDRAIKDLPDIYKQLNGDAQAGGLKGYIQRKGESALGAVPVVGNALSGVSDIITESPENRQYQAHQERLKSALLGALGGTAAGSGDVNHFVNSLVPEFGDTYEVKQAKQASALDALKKHQKFDILDKWGMTRKGGK